MRRQIIAALLCAPALASAQKLVVEYQGTVSLIERAELAEAPPYAVGDPIGGRFVIDAGLAPPDASRDPRIGRYSSGSTLTDFVLGPTRVVGPGSGDLVLVHDDWRADADTAPYDGFFVRDQSIGTDGAFSLVLGMRRTNSSGQLFSNDGLAQSFTAKPAAGTTLWGFLERGFGEFWRIVNFTLDRFSVTPGVCRA